MVDPLVQEAMRFATEAHLGQRRKYTLEPYIVHPSRVADLVSAVTYEPAVIAAAWLHDVVEDTSVTIEEIADKFGETVAQLVADVTNVTTKETGSRKYRKEIERLHLATADPRAKTIKLADILDNVPSIVKYDPRFAPIYVSEKWQLLPCLRGGNYSLWYQVEMMLFKSDARG